MHHETRLTCKALNTSAFKYRTDELVAPASHLTTAATMDLIMCEDFKDLGASPYHQDNLNVLANDQQTVPSLSPMSITPAAFGAGYGYNSSYSPTTAYTPPDSASSGTSTFSKPSPTGSSNTQQQQQPPPSRHNFVPRHKPTRSMSAGDLPNLQHYRNLQAQSAATAASEATLAQLRNGSTTAGAFVYKVYKFVVRLTSSKESAQCLV